MLKSHTQEVMMPGTTEIMIIVAVIVLLFGASAIPKLAKSLGQAKGEFEKGIKEGKTKTKDEEKKEKPEDNK